MPGTLVPFGTRMPGVFDDFRREMDTLMQRFFAGEEAGETPQWFSPLANVSETEKEYEISIELPGLKPEEFSVELKGNELWVTGERHHDTEARDKTYHRIERQYGQFRRVIRLGEDVSTEGVEAEYRDGVLKITVPKSETSRTRHIEVRSS